MLTDLEFDRLVESLRQSPGIAAKHDIGSVAEALGLQCAPIAVGDDTAAIPDGDGYLLFAMEGFINVFVEKDPWFAGWCAVMVNISDVVAMGGRPIAVIDAIWANGSEAAKPVLEGMKAAALAFNVPIVGGHTNIKTDRSQLSAAILGRAKVLLTSFDARPGEKLIVAVDHRGRYREPFDNWEAATIAPPERLRTDLELLPQIAEAGLSRAAKDISQGGIVGTAIMLAESSGVGMNIDLEAIPVPKGVSLERWLKTFPSFGYILTASPDNVAAILSMFSSRDIAAAVIGDVVVGSEVSVTSGHKRALARDHALEPLMGLGKVGAAL